ncbi:MAG: pentapeptide repeat-containing protein [Anaerolineae bacterium]|nr:pentapeptide repeat-containing protein [Anaerolineae bacterium]
MEIPGAEDRQREMQEIDEKYPHSYRVFTGIGLVAIAILSGFVFITDSEGYVANLFTELLSIVVTVAILDTLASIRAEKQLKAQLIREMNSGDNGIAARAASEMKARGWGFGQDRSLEKKSFVGANLEYADLGGANLRSACMSFVHFQHANLSNSNLESANLWNTNLESANLINANLTRAKLQQARMQWVHAAGANLSGANLMGADLWGAVLWAVDLRGADLRHADLSEAQFHDALSQYGTPVFDENTFLPDGTHWTPNSDLTVFTNPSHPIFWRSDVPHLAAHERRFKKRTE